MELRSSLISCLFIALLTPPSRPGWCLLSCKQRILLPLMMEGQSVAPVLRSLNIDTEYRFPHAVLVFSFLTFSFSYLSLRSRYLSQLGPAPD